MKNNKSLSEKIRENFNGFENYYKKANTHFINAIIILHNYNNLKNNSIKLSDSNINIFIN